MTSPFVDRVEYQVIGRDTNASQVFRNVADAADSAGDSLSGLGTDLDRVNRSIDDTADRMRQLVSSLEDLSATRQITVTTNVREVLGSVEDNRQVLDLLNDRFENLTVNVIATVNQLVELNDGLTTIDDNRTAVITLGDDVRQLTQNIDATVDSVVSLNDGIQTIDDNRAVIVTVDDDFRTLTQNIDATVDSVVSLNDGIQTIDDNRTAVITLGDDVRQLTQNIDGTVDSVVRLNDGIQTIDDNRTAVITIGDDVRQLTQNIDGTVDSVVRLNDGIQTIDDNRAAVITLGDDVRALTQNIDGTVDSVVRLNDGIQTIDDNRAVIVTVDDDFRTLTQNIDGTVDSVVRLRDGLTTVDDNRPAIAAIRDDFRTTGDGIEATRQIVIRFNDEVGRVDDNRPGIAGLGGDFNGLATNVERANGRVVDLNRELRNTDDIDIRERVNVGRQIVETVSSDRDRLERAGLIAGAAIGHGLMTSLSNAITNGVDKIPFVGPFLKKIIGSIALASPELAVAVTAAGTVVAGAVAVVVANALTAGLLAALGGGVIATGIIIALQDPRIMDQAKFTGRTIASTLGDAVDKSGFKDKLVDAMVTVREEFPKLKQGLTDLFSAAGPLMQPLVEGMLGFAKNVLPGVTTAVRNMKPVFDTLGDWLPKLGKTIGDFFSTISRHAPQLASALGYVLGFLDTSITVIGHILDGLAMFEPAAEFILHWTAELLKFFGPGTALMVGLQVSSIYFGLMEGAVRLLWRAISDTAILLPSFEGGLSGVLGRLGPLASAAGFAGGLLGLFGGSASRAGSDARDASGKTQGLTDKLRAVPNADPKVTLHDKTPPTRKVINDYLAWVDRQKVDPIVVVDDRASGTLERIQNKLRELNGKRVTFHVQGVQDGAGPAFYHGLASGGPVYGPGMKGVDSKLMMLAPGEHVFTAREVDAAGGHEAIYALRRSLLGTTPVGGGGATAPVGRRPSGMDTDVTAATLRRALSGMTLVIDDRTGRTAQLIARGG